MKQKIFTEDELARIKAAVNEAESTTSGEIVTFFAHKSDDYREVNLQSTLLFVAAPVLILAILSYGWLLPLHVTPIMVAVVCVISGLVGFLLPVIWPAYRRLLISSDRLRDAVERRAIAAFLSEEVFNTENRTGILIFVSHFEHVVEVIGDSGINAKVDQSEWDEVVNLIVTGIKTKDATGGLVRGIRKCGELLTTAGVDKPPDNPNELSNDLRTT